MEINYHGHLIDDDTQSLSDSLYIKCTITATIQSSHSEVNTQSDKGLG